ncbi:Chitinase [Streptoalloteichus tenebrarius]|uniref:Chitinase n=1 Tax=Streptoalloteichus tenebrarius (strain ATCC 17920 / DSM 40477 / JCM 4838 / CBS 697.72 / NBRC 16177 / NCIMB 11028 / NRRL B-12390 / A12253. 1 / ISP 5477) TaxID=1933 RepID=A0ABT1HUT9_STRSD|nr:glycosyl hydrolase family 18 protein [Streptoalloteichus tenebrarius]MCP2259190.1 Chitinase [Streptoalloteichus tenebrarius]BFF04329.1 hypothetical protein GCM10020241_60040 [Streptoalloteichus tenebrarius]
MTTADATARKMILYYQTQFVEKDGKRTLVSPMDLVTHDAGVTDINVGAIHLNRPKKKEDPVFVTVNDTVPADAKLKPLWDELKKLREKKDKRIAVHAFIGGDAKGTFTLLEEDFEKAYAPLRKFLQDYKMDGADLDIEKEGVEDMKNPTATVTKVIDALRKDFGEKFVISMAPGASELTQDVGAMSGVKYKELYRTRGSKINRFHAQFYCTWGDMSTKKGYLDVVKGSGIPAEKIVAGVVTNNKHCGDYIKLATLKSVLQDLKKDCPGFGGVFGWEYHLSGEDEQGAGYKGNPWKWAKEVSSVVRS